MLRKLFCFCLLTVFGCVFLAASALPDMKKSDELTLEGVMRSVNSKPAEKIKNARLVFEADGAGMDFSRIIFWAAGDAGFRVDFVSSGEISTICRKGEKFWGYESQSGLFQLTDNEVNQISYDLALCPFACFKGGLYKPLTPSGNGILRNMQCRMYETATVSGNPDIRLEVWVDEATELPQQIKMHTPNGFYAISYLDYQDFDGMKLAARINTSSDRGITRLKLVDVKYNENFPEDIFVESDSGKNPQLLALQKRVAALALERKPVPQKAKKAVAPAAPAVKAVPVAVKPAAPKLNTRAISDVKNTIAKLDIKINEREKQLEVLKNLIQQDREQALDIASKASGITRYRYRRSWAWGYYGSRRLTVRHKEDRHKKKLVKSLYKESEAAVKEYEKLSKELSELRLQRADANTMLERLQAGK